MNTSESVDVGAAYREIRQRLNSVLANISKEQWESKVPHCPAWTVRETLAHLAGVVDDGINGNMVGVATEPWTQAQVDKRADKTGIELLEEWNTWAPFVEARATEVGMAMSQLLFDAVTHEHDLRFAVGEPGGRDSTALWIAARFLAGRLPNSLVERNLPSITFIVDDETLHDGGAGALTLRATTFDFVRSCGSRRSLEQFLALNWSADATDVVAHLMPFAPPTTNLVE